MIKCIFAFEHIYWHLKCKPTIWKMPEILSKQTTPVDWIRFPHWVARAARAISDFACRCYKPYEILMSMQRKKKPFLIRSWLKSRWAAASSAAERSHLRFSARPLGTVWCWRSHQAASERSESPESLGPQLSMQRRFCHLAPSCWPSFTPHLQPPSASV